MAIAGVRSLQALISLISEAKGSVTVHKVALPSLGASVKRNWTAWKQLQPDSVFGCPVPGELTYWNKRLVKKLNRQPS